ncbi:hypothetical protein D0T53_08720 [Dysgonomonas sp. 216]|uniref:hypothetical protein n=1 Tax=Dysgonomonas sp. 216 TaxID=2302934 RepID=UPI0013D64813|nr:hypothetical protein [Dysgonomonas sp. 216]NDW18992.1 hypothetical protein [Dysgonomonas sp. 216]
MKKKLYILASSLFTAFNLLAAIPNANAVTDDCFTPMFPTGNLVPDPEITAVSKFSESWGSVSITMLKSEIYCGTSSGKISNVATGSFSFNVDWQPNTKYVIKAMVKTNGTFQIGTGNTYINNGNASTDFEIANTNNEWIVFEKRFTTGNSATSGNCWFNNYQKAGTIGYIDNWEIYEDIDIKVSTTSLAFDENSREQVIKVSGVQLSQNISITLPSGLTAEPASIAATAKDIDVKITYDGSTDISGNIVFKSGDTEKQISAVSINAGNCFEPTFPEGNLVSDPHMLSLSNFSVTGTCRLVSVVSEPGVPYCGITCVKVGDESTTNSGSIGVSDIEWEPNTIYRVVAKVKSMGTFCMSATGVDGDGTDRNFVFATTSNQWYALDHSFITGEDVSKGQCSFNNGNGSTTKYIYVDSWEIYKIVPKN